MSKTAQSRSAVTTERPQIQRVYVNVRDAITGKIEHRTLYGATNAQVIEHLDKLAKVKATAGAA
jgi:hypothetical protein